MLSSRNRSGNRKIRQRSATGAAPSGRPGAKAGVSNTRYYVAGRPASTSHPLTDVRENDRLFDYERKVKDAFDGIVPALKKVSALQHEADFVSKAQRIAMSQLGFELPALLLEDAWVDQLDMRSLFAWSLFQTYRRFADDVFTSDPLGNNDEEAFQRMLEECGFHLMDVTPCADGRAAHVIRYILRLPTRAVRRRSFAGAMFDIEDSLGKWTRTELVRFREGVPNTADTPTRYLKTVVYHFSSLDPAHQGCAAHGSDDSAAIAGGISKLKGFQQAVQNTHCCGASIDTLLIGMDTDTDAIRIHMPDASGDIDPNNYVDSMEAYDSTAHMSAVQAEQWIADHIRQKGGAALNGGEMADGMARFMAYLLKNNLSQVEYVRRFHNGHYSDVGHAERFIGAGIGFEEVQLRNLTFFSYLNTVEEAAGDLDVGVSIFTGLNVAHGLPVPVVVRFDYHGNVPGARQRAEEHCKRVSNAFHSRYSDLSEKGLLHTLQVVRDINAAGKIEILDCSVKTEVAGGH
jgi:carboxysome shell carbonic anhydrase